MKLVLNTNIARLNLTVVVITHDLNTIKNVLDKFSIIADGNIELTGTYEDALNANNAKIMSANRFIEKDSWQTWSQVKALRTTLIHLGNQISTGISNCKTNNFTEFKD